MSTDRSVAWLKLYALHIKASLASTLPLLSSKLFFLTKRRNKLLIYISSQVWHLTYNNSFLHRGGKKKSQIYKKQTNKNNKERGSHYVSLACFINWFIKAVN